jgi:hypothetical protein
MNWREDRKYSDSLILKPIKKLFDDNEYNSLRSFCFSINQVILWRDSNKTELKSSALLKNESGLKLNKTIMTLLEK